MRNILDQFQPSTGAFLPVSVREYIALQIARQLNDTDGIESYMSMVNDNVASAIARAMRTNA